MIACRGPGAMTKKSKRSYAEAGLAEAGGVGSALPAASSAVLPASDFAVPSRGVFAALLILGFLASLSALFQWMELMVAKAGGALFCRVSETLDCGVVWRAS